MVCCNQTYLIDTDRMKGEFIINVHSMWIIKIPPLVGARSTKAAILKLNLFSQESVTRHPSPYRDCNVISNEHISRVMLCELSHARCPNWALCGSVKVQNNTSVFQCWKAQWQLHASARWLRILINQKGGSKPWVPPHAVWSGAWRSFARPLLRAMW